MEEGFQSCLDCTHRTLIWRDDTMRLTPLKEDCYYSFPKRREHIMHRATSGSTSFGRETEAGGEARARTFIVSHGKGKARQGGGNSLGLANLSRQAPGYRVVSSCMIPGPG